MEEDFEKEAKPGETFHLNPCRIEQKTFSMRRNHHVFRKQFSRDHCMNKMKRGMAAGCGHNEQLSKNCKMVKLKARVSPSQALNN